jgi:hypothetical protein
MFGAGLADESEETGTAASCFKGRFSGPADSDAGDTIPNRTASKGGREKDQSTPTATARKTTAPRK